MQLGSPVVLIDASQNNRVTSLPVRMGFLLILYFPIAICCISAWSQSDSNPAAAKLQSKRALKNIGTSAWAMASAMPSARDTVPIFKTTESGAVASKQDPQSTEPQLALIRSIRSFITSDCARVIISMDGETRYKKARLSNPDRIYFDILNSRLSDALSSKVLPVEDRFLRQIRVSQNRSNTVRVVLDIAKIAEVSVSKLHDPFSIVIEIHADENNKSGKLLQPNSETSPESYPAALPAISVEKSAAPDVVNHSDEMSSFESPAAREAQPEKGEVKAQPIEFAQSTARRTEAGTSAETAGDEFKPKPEVRREATSPIVQNQEPERLPAVNPASDSPLPASSPIQEAESSEARESQKLPRRELFVLHGQLRNETAYRVARPMAFSKIKNFAYLEMNGKLSQNLSYDLSTRMYYDAVFDWTNTFSENVKQDQQWDAELRNAFVDISVGPMDLRLGKQQIVWGQAVNLFFADVVNARDLREFVLPDLDDIRIPMWAGDLEFTFGNTHMEFVAIPILDHDKIGVPGSDFAPRIPSLPEGAVLNVGDIKMPANNARNGVYGFRLSQMVSGWDLGGFYLYGYDYSPTYFRRIEVNPETQRITVNVMPEITRKRTVGATFSKDISAVVLKGEFVYDRDRNFTVTDPVDFDGIVKSDYFEYLLGLDYTFFRKVDFNVQFFQQFVLNPVDTLFRDDQESFLSIWFKTGFFNNRLEPELFAAFTLEPNRADFMLRPKLNFTFNSHLKTALGADLFGGDYNGVFGQFDNSDRVYLELRFLF
jgi:hypothetical protein